MSRRLTPSGVAAQQAKGAMHNLFADKNIAPRMGGGTVGDMRAVFDAAMVEAGIVRTEPPERRVRLFRSARIWRIRPAAGRA